MSCKSLDLYLNRAGKRISKVVNLRSDITKKTKQYTSSFQQILIETEKLLWRYIDRECTDEERREVEHLLENDPSVRAEYETMLDMHYDLINLFRLKKADIPQIKTKHK